MGSRPRGPRRRAQSRYACLWVPRFAALALVRSDPELLGRPVAAMTGSVAIWSVHEVTTEAWARGVRPGMSVGEAVTHAPDLVCRPRDVDAEQSAAGALLDAALATSPRVEAAAPDRTQLDLAGVDRLFGAEPRIAERLAHATADLGVPARVGIASSRTAAALAARATPGITIVEPGQEPAFLAPQPVALLEPSPDLAECLERWGIRTLGELQALPAAALLARLGPPGPRLQAFARGEDTRPFVAHTPAEPWIEALALDWEITALDGLVFVLRPLVERLCARLGVRERGATALWLGVRLADGGMHRHGLPFVGPLREPRTLLRLLQTGLERLTLPAPIVALTLEAESAPLRAVQPDLFEPTRSSPHELAQTLGRLIALVGRDRVGAPVLADTHRPTAIGVAPFTGGAGQRSAGVTVAIPGTLVRRRFAPPLSAVVAIREGQPRRVEADGVRGSVLACAGPWRSAGEWWADTAWSREEWDVALADGAVYRLVLDHATRGWSIDAVYD